MLKRSSIFILAIIAILLLDSPLYAKSPKQYFTKTSDGWTLSLYRYKPATIEAEKNPVILCHGFNYNNYLWDLDEKHSLARYLKEKGYDVWAINLRGSGDSSKPTLSNLRSLIKFQVGKILKTIFRAPMNINKFSWSIDDHIERDLPAIIDLVRSETGRKKITWIGHSMGGMAMYAYLETMGPEKIERLVTISTTAKVPQPPNKFLARIAKQRPITKASLLINTTVASQVRNITLGTVKLPWEELFYNAENMDRLTTIRMFRKAIDDTSPGVISQFSDAVRDGDLKSFDKKFNYTKNLRRVDIPVLLIAGAADKMATPKAVEHAYREISSRDKEFRVFSKANGYSADYGHCDLILGKRSEEEVYPFIYNWLESH